MSLIVPRNLSYYVSPSCALMNELAPYCTPEQEKAYRKEQDIIYSILKEWNTLMQQILRSSNAQSNKQLRQLIHKTRAWIAPSSANDDSLAYALQDNHALRVLEQYVTEHAHDGHIMSRLVDITIGMSPLQAAFVGLQRVGVPDNRHIPIARLVYRCIYLLYHYLTEKNKIHIEALISSSKDDKLKCERITYLEELKKKTKTELKRRAEVLLYPGEAVANKGDNQKKCKIDKEDELYLIALCFFSDSKTPLFSNLYTRAQVDYVFYGHCGQREYQTELLKLFDAHIPKKIDANSPYNKNKKSKSQSSPLNDAIFIFFLILLAMCVLALLFYVNTVNQ